MSDMLSSWGSAGEKLLRTMRLEAARSGHGDVAPAHLLLALLDQPELHGALRAAGLAPDVYAIRARVAESSLGPEAYDESLPLSRLTRTILEGLRDRGEAETAEMLFLVALRQSLGNNACRALLAHGGLDVDRLDQALSRIA